MIAALHHSLLAIALVTLLELAVIAPILLRPHRDPASRIARMVVVGALPLLGMLAYLFLGEVNIGRRRVERLHAVLAHMPLIPCHAGAAAGPAAAIPERHRHLFQLGHSMSGFPSHRRQYRTPAAELKRNDRCSGGRRRCRKGSRPYAVLYLAAGPQRLQRAGFSDVSKPVECPPWRGRRSSRTPRDATSARSAQIMLLFPIRNVTEDHLVAATHFPGTKRVASLDMPLASTFEENRVRPLPARHPSSTARSRS